MEQRNIFVSSIFVICQKDWEIKVESNAKISCFASQVLPYSLPIGPTHSLPIRLTQGIISLSFTSALLDTRHAAYFEIDL